MLWLGRCVRARTFLLIREAIMCLLAKSTRVPPEATIILWRSWQHWCATPATRLCASTTGCHKRRPTAESRAMSKLWALVSLALATLSLMFPSAANTTAIVNKMTESSTARCEPMTIFRNVLRRKSVSTVLIMNLSARRLRLLLCQWQDRFTPSFCVSSGY